jgi:hypothetical protein
VIAEILLCLAWFVAAAVDARCGRRLIAAFDVGNATIMLYGLLTFIGVRAACADMAPLARTVRQRWLAARAPWLSRMGRLVTPGLIGLVLLLRPAPTTGFHAPVNPLDRGPHSPQRMVGTAGPPARSVGASSPVRWVGAPRAAAVTVSRSARKP